jgi:hypothetical protein
MCQNVSFSIDIAVWGIASDKYYQAVAAVTNSAFSTIAKNQTSPQA